MRLVFWLLFALMSGVYLAMILWSVPIITNASHGLLLFDVRLFGYSFEQAQAFMAALPEDGRLFYLNVQQMLDSTFPALFAVVMVMACVHLFRGIYRSIAIVLVLAAVGFDYLENTAVAVMLRAGAGGLTPEMVASASGWSQLKWATLTLALLVLMAGLVMALLARRKTGGDVA